MPIPDTKRDFILNTYGNSFMFLKKECHKIFYWGCVPVPARSIKHQAVALKLAAALLRYAESSKLGRVLQAPCDVILSHSIVMRPDILFIKKERRGLIGKTHLWGVPDLVIDILSNSIHRADLQAKKKIYADYGVQEYWVVDSDANTIDPLVWSELGYVLIKNGHKTGRLYSPLLPDLNLHLSDIFADEDD
jgi:Uma2 family endonuclease